MINKNWLLWVLGTLLVIITFKTWIIQPDKLEIALDLAEENRSELEKVIKHYTNTDKDEEKLDAASFLISNSIIHASQDIELVDISGERIEFNPMDYPNPQATRDAKDSILQTSRSKRIINFDILELESDYLIKHIDFSVNVWRNSPWKKDVSFERFCRYILPYRVLNESLTSWTEILYKKYAPLIDTLQEKTIVNACKAINAQLAKEITYDERWYLSGTGTQSVTDLLKSCSGNCDDLTVYGICAMRAVGIPVAVDFDVHGRFNFGHTWCAVLDENNKSLSFGAGEQQPGEHGKTFEQYRWRGLTRVFRRSFEQNKNSFGPKVKDMNTVPGFFQTNNIVDVTDEYINVFDIEYSIPELPLNQKFLYLCIYNNKTWKPIQWGKVKYNKVVFPNMGAKIMYFVGYYHNGQLIPVSLPFVLEINGNKSEISGSGSLINKTFSMTKISGYEYAKSGKEYELYYWQNDKWKYLKKVIPPKDSLLEIGGLNQNTLYRFQNTSRPFIVSDTLTTW